MTRSSSVESKFKKEGQDFFKKMFVAIRLFNCGNVSSESSQPPGVYVLYGLPDCYPIGNQ